MKLAAGKAGFAGLSSGITTQVLGGLAFIVPAQLPGFTAIQITLGRYLAYGALSLALFAVVTRGHLRVYDRATWTMAALFGLSANIGYYFLLVVGVEYAGASAAALIIGILPITVALYGNWRRREYPFSLLLGPVALILTGQILINLLASGGGAGKGHTGGTYVLGLACATLALALWTWFAVANAAFLREHPTLSASTWTSLIGVTTLVITGVALIGIALLGPLGIDTTALPAPVLDRDLLRLLAGSIVLGVGVSWVAGWLWSRASRLLPISLAGQLIVCEPLTVLVYVFASRHHLPSPVELIAIALIIGGVLFGINTSRRDTATLPTERASSDAA